MPKDEQTVFISGITESDIQDEFFGPHLRKVTDLIRF